MAESVDERVEKGGEAERSGWSGMKMGLVGALLLIVLLSVYVAGLGPAVVYVKHHPDTVVSEVMRVVYGPMDGVLSGVDGFRGLMIDYVRWCEGVMGY